MPDYVSYKGLTLAGLQAAFNAGLVASLSRRILFFDFVSGDAVRVQGVELQAFVSYDNAGVLLSAPLTLALFEGRTPEEATAAAASAAAANAAGFNSPVFAGYITQARKNSPYITALVQSTDPNGAFNFLAGNTGLFAGEITASGYRIISGKTIYNIGNAVSGTVDLARANGATQKLTAAGTVDLEGPNDLREGETILLKVIQDGSGSRTINADSDWQGTVTFTSTANNFDIIQITRIDGALVATQVLSDQSP